MNSFIGGKFQINTTLNELKERLDSPKFLRSHKSFLINLDAIEEIETWFNSTCNLLAEIKNRRSFFRGRIFLIQLLNIAGLGPIFGAVQGALFGPAAFVWIALVSIFAGGVHDYFSGMLSVRHEGFSLSSTISYPEV